MVRHRSSTGTSKPASKPAASSVIEPQTSDGPEHFGRQWVSGIDIAGDQILVNLAATNGETHPYRALLINFDGTQEDLADYDAHVHAASFLAS